MFHETIGDQAHHVLPIVVALVGQLLLQDGTNGDHGGKGVAEQEKLEKKLAAQNTENGRGNNGGKADDFNYRCEHLEDPQIRQGEKSDAAVTRTEENVARDP